MVNAFLSYIDAKNLRNKRHLVAVSGGVDSMVLAYLLRTHGLDLGIAHVNHGTRDGGSDRDAAFVKQWAETHQCPFYCLDLDKTIAQQANFQAEARKLRYEWMENIRSTHHYDTIMTAHHYDDHIETFLMHLLRGSGPRGLAGIPDGENHRYRPLLSFTKDSIMDLATTQGIPFVHDSSNDSDHYLRNRIRHHVLPTLQQQESYRQIGESLALLRSANSLLEDLIPSIDENGIDQHMLQQLTEPVTYLYYALRGMQFTASQLQDMVDAQSGSAFESKTGQIILAHRGKLYIQETKTVTEKETTVVIDQMGTYTYQTYQLQISLIQVEDIQFAEANTFYLGFDIRPFPLTLTSVQNGDRFQPLGMDGKTQKVSDFINNNKLSPAQKQEVIVLKNTKNDIVALLPHRISHLAKVDVNRRFVMEIKCQRLG